VARPTSSSGITVQRLGEFHVIVGSRADWLQFVVIALVADMKRPSAEGEIDTFATPSIVHFCEVLLIASILSAPRGRGRSRPRLLHVRGVRPGVCGRGVRRGQHMSHQPVLED
jgi:hypothetical protein